ncbi:hypothetical protein LSTR_LSTR014963 [Laodelphax striatellus]|uniref:C2H2-type domain-containing protein n=1 Tax=Laodelphax striatellus TaxID=195883 RepID=A0A482WKZ1_LAOST|nr:hypothetical protein LSTR_LSTR014963 [Laodelphax striatellus]
MTKPNSSGGAGGAAALTRTISVLAASLLEDPACAGLEGRAAAPVMRLSTPEVVHLMSFECDIIYECRVCKNLFRSVANFISHKRIYCTRRFNHVQNSQVKKQVHAEKLLKKQGDASNKSSPTGSTSSSNNKRLAATPDKSVSLTFPSIEKTNNYRN